MPTHLNTFYPNSRYVFEKNKRTQQCRLKDTIKIMVGGYDTELAYLAQSK